MDLFKLLEKEKRFIDREIEKVLPRKISHEFVSRVVGKPRFSCDVLGLNGSVSVPAWNFLDRGGKRWRPVLMLAVNQALNGERRKALKLTPIPELIHNGTIIVDDIEDFSETRRGKPALHLLFGEDIAINVGNTLYFLPLLVLTNSKIFSEKQRIEFYELYFREMVRLSFGQALDIFWHKGNKKIVSEKEYLQMCLFKTGVLARFSAKLGAIAANTEKKMVELIGLFGESLGVGFQIQDDVLNLVPASKKWGKDIGEDITEGKRSLPVIHALKKLNKKEKTELLKILDKHTKNKTQIKKAIHLIQKTGAIEYSQQLAKKFVQESWEKLNKVLPENQGKKKLKAFADFAVERKI